MCVSCAHLGRQSLALSKETHTHMHIKWSFARFGALNTQMSNAFIWTNNEKVVARAKFNIFLPLNICFCHLAPSHWQLTLFTLLHPYIGFFFFCFYISLSSEHAIWAMRREVFTEWWTEAIQRTITLVSVSLLLLLFSLKNEEKRPNVNIVAV